MIVGAGDATGRGGARVVRYLAYYTGDMPETKHLRLPHSVAVRPPVRTFAGGDAGVEAARARIQKERRLADANLLHQQTMLEMVEAAMAGPTQSAPGSSSAAASDDGAEDYRAEDLAVLEDLALASEEAERVERSRRTAMTPEKEARAEELLAAGASQAEVARNIGVSGATFSRWMASQRATVTIGGDEDPFGAGGDDEEGSGASALASVIPAPAVRAR